MTLSGKIYLLFIITLLVTSSCVRYILLPESKKIDPEIAEARNWFQNNRKQLDALALESKSERLNPQF